jgi:hypothetical protein
MEELEKLIMALYKNNYNYMKIIIICKGPPPRERAPGTHWIGGWVGPRTSLDVVEKRNIMPLPGIHPLLSSP